MVRPFFLFSALFFCLTILSSPAYSQSQPERSERLAFAAYRHGQWDLYSLTPEGTTPRQLTNDLYEDTDPAYSPDGTRLAFASRRENNWDIYVLDLQTGEQLRLTHHPHYDGAPTWRPDGRQIVYESYQNGDLDIWLADADGAEPAVNLTAESLEGDFAPAYSPDGQHLAFTSWRNGSKDLFLLEVETNEITPLTDAPTAEMWPVWHPNGQSLAYVVGDLGDQEIFTINVDTPESPEIVTWLGRTDGPAWSPQGNTLAAVFHRWDGESIALQTPGADTARPRLLTDVVWLQGRLTWHAQAVDFGRTVGALDGNGESTLFKERLFPNENGEEPYNLIRINNLETGTPWLADTVDDSFLAWRYRLRDEVGYDFLGTLSDAARDVGAYTETSQYASWHKSGRAIDTLFDYHVDGQLAHEIVREDYGGESYWRIYLRCVDQSGGCGRPLTANPWNYSSRARTQIAPEQGGIEKKNISGYYVDMTAMAREYGWERISSHDDEEEFSWTWHFLAFEYWHYQKKLANGQRTSINSSASNWYQAMEDIYPTATLERYFNWQKMRALDDPPHLIALKGVPLPLEMKPWWDLIQH